MKKAQDAVLDTARTLTERPQPTTNRLFQPTAGASVPAPAEMATHAFDLIDRLKGNLRDFTSQLMAALAPSTAESPPTPAQAASKAHIHLSPEVAAIIALATLTA
jgi:hypothetical protein